MNHVNSQYEHIQAKIESWFKKVYFMNVNQYFGINEWGEFVCKKLNVPKGFIQYIHKYMIDYLKINDESINKPSQPLNLLNELFCIIKSIILQWDYELLSEFLQEHKWSSNQI